MAEDPNRSEKQHVGTPKKGDAAGVERCKRELKIDHARIRAHCAKHGLELPHDVPPEGAE